ncbi:YetF domain-containing protein, partial [Providencia stuartii]
YLTKKFNFIRNVTIGNPIPIISKGNFIMENILEKGNKIDILNISSRIHAQGVHSFQEIYYAQIEPDGQLTVICDPTNMPSVIIMKDGVVRLNELQSIEKDEEWLNKQMVKHGIDKPESVFLAEFWQGEVKFIRQDGKIQ